MPTIHFKSADGRLFSVNARSGDTAMEVAVDNSVPGIVAECGGACACATCHVYVDRQWLVHLPPLSDMEDAMLDSAADRSGNSRLSCQIEVTDELDGLQLTVADNGA